MIRALTPAYGVAALQATTFPCSLVNLQGYFRGSTVDAWLQVHDAAAAPTAGAVPLKSWALPQQSPFSWKFDPGDMPLKVGLYVCVSTTEGTFTISTDLADILVDVLEYEEPVLSQTTVPVNGTPASASTLTVFATGAGKTLTRVDVTHSGTGDAGVAGSALGKPWLLVFANSARTILLRALPLFTWNIDSSTGLKTYTTLASVSFRFGGGSLQDQFIGAAVNNAALLEPVFQVCAAGVISGIPAVAQEQATVRPGAASTAPFSGCYLAVSTSPSAVVTPADTYTLLAYVH